MRERKGTRLMREEDVGQCFHHPASSPWTGDNDKVSLLAERRGNIPLPVP